MRGLFGSIAAKGPLLGGAVLLLALGGCGRKGGLDLPPVAAGTQPAYAAPAAAPAQATPQPGFNPLGPLETTPAEERPTAAPGAKKRIILDPILD